MYVANSPQVKCGKGNPDVLKKAYMQDKPDSAQLEVPQAPVPQITKGNQSEADARNSSDGASDRPERRLSKKYSAEQLDKVLEILQKVMKIEDTSTNPPVSELYDDIVPEQGEWDTDMDNYVDMKKIDDVYDTIPELRKQNFYFNVDDRPPLPPKPRLRPKSQKVLPGGTKSVLLPKPDHLSKSGKSSSFGKECILISCNGIDIVSINT